MPAILSHRPKDTSARQLSLLAALAATEKTNLAFGHLRVAFATFIW